MMINTSSLPVCATDGFKFHLPDWHKFISIAQLCGLVVDVGDVKDGTNIAEAKQRIGNGSRGADRGVIVKESGKCHG